jgi:hypothetical protein
MVIPRGFLQLPCRGGRRICRVQYSKSRWLVVALTLFAGVMSAAGMLSRLLA